MAQQATTEAKNKMNGAKKHAAHTTEEAASTVMSEIQTLSQDLSSRAREMTSEIKEYYKTGHKYVRSNPVKSLAVAAGAGLLIGGFVAMMIGRRDSSES